MAFVDDTLLEDDEQAAQAGGPTLASSAAPQSAQAQSQPQATGPKRKTPGNFADLSEYLRVNAPQQFGTKIAGKIGSEIEQGQSTLGDAQNQFKERVDSNTIKDSQGLIPQVSQNPQAIDPNAFAKIRDAEYKGPKTLGDTQDLSSRVQGAVGTAVGKANATGSEGGRFALLDSYFGRPQYNQGQKSLDNLLIQNDPNSQQAFSEMRNRAQDLNANAKSLGGNLQQYGGMGQQQTVDTRKAARDAIGIDSSGIATKGGAIDLARGQADKRFSDEKTRLSNELKQAQDLAKANRYGLSPEFLKAMGVEGYDKGYGVDPSGNRFIQANSISKEQAVSPEEAQRLRALESLGLQDNYLSDGAYGTSGDVKGYSFDKDAYGREVETQKYNYLNDSRAIEKEIGDAQKAYDQLTANIKPDAFKSRSKYLNWDIIDAAQKRIDDAKAAQQNVKAKYLGELGDRNFDPGSIRWR